MNNAWNISGMTCEACEEKIGAALRGLPNVTSVKADRHSGQVSIESNSTISTSQVENALKFLPKYNVTGPVTAAIPVKPTALSIPKAEPVTTLATYRPLFILFGLITAVSLLPEWHAGAFNVARWMANFMGGFFVTFAFFKLLDLPKFADAYSTYDILAARSRAYALAYPFIELILGFSYLLGFNGLILNAVTLVVMSLSTIGVVQALRQKKKFQCACLGTVFNLPMSQVTLYEDLLMVLMAAAGLAGLHS